MKKFVICVFIFCIGMTVFAGPKDRHKKSNHRHEHNRGLYIANGILGIVDKSLKILSGPRPIIVPQPVVTQPIVVTPPIITQQPVIVNQTPQVVITKPASQIIQIGNDKYLIYTDDNGKKHAALITK